MAAVTGTPAGPPGPPVPAAPPEAERLAYQALAELLNSEEAAFWTRNNILVLVQGGLIAAAASIVGSADKVFGADPPPRAQTWLFAALAVLAFVGFATAVAWLLTVRRGQRIADTIRHQLTDIELDWKDRGFLPAGSYLAFTRWARQLNNEEPVPGGWQVPRNGWNNHRLAQTWAALGWFFALLWSALFLVFAGAAMRCVPGQPAGDDSHAARERTLIEATQAAARSAASAASAAEAAARAAVAAASAAESAARAAARCGNKRSAGSGGKPQGGGRAAAGASSSCR